MKLFCIVAGLDGTYAGIGERSCRSGGRIVVIQRLRGLAERGKNTSCIEQFGVLIASTSASQLGHTALMIAAEKGRTAVVDVLLKYNAQIDLQSKVRPYFNACILLVDGTARPNGILACFVTLMELVLCLKLNTFNIL